MDLIELEIEMYFTAIMNRVRSHHACTEIQRSSAHGHRYRASQPKSMAPMSPTGALTPAAASVSVAEVLSAAAVPVPVVASAFCPAAVLALLTASLVFVPVSDAVLLQTTSVGISLTPAEPQI